MPVHEAFSKWINTLEVTDVLYQNIKRRGELVKITAQKTQAISQEERDWLEVQRVQIFEEIEALMVRFKELEPEVDPFESPGES